MTRTATALLCAAGISAAGMTAVYASGKTAPSPAPATQPAPALTGGGSGGGGGGKVAPVTMPADWPAAVAVPPGQLTGVSLGSKDPQWVLSLLGQGDANQYTASVDALYTATGYTLVGGSPYVLTNGTFTITIAMQPNDHSATSTIVAFQLHRN